MIHSLFVLCSRPSQPKWCQPSCLPCCRTLHLFTPSWGKTSPPPQPRLPWACTSRSSVPQRRPRFSRTSCDRKPCSPWRAPCLPSWWAPYPAPTPHPPQKTHRKIKFHCVWPVCSAVKVRVHVCLFAWVARTAYVCLFVCKALRFFLFFFKCVRVLCLLPLFCSSLFHKGKLL